MSGGPLLVVRDDDPTPPFEQVRRQIAALIASGALAPGLRLPAVRQLAADLGLAVGTVARAYRELEVAGEVVSRRGAGTRVAPPADPAQGAAVPRPAAEAVRKASLGAAGGAAVREEVLGAMVDDLVARARAMGVRDSDVATAVRSALRRSAPVPTRRGAVGPGPTRPLRAG